MYHFSISFKIARISVQPQNRKRYSNSNIFTGRTLSSLIKNFVLDFLLFLLVPAFDTSEVFILKSDNELVASDSSHVFNPITQTTDTEPTGTSDNMCALYVRLRNEYIYVCVNTFAELSKTWSCAVHTIPYLLQSSFYMFCMKSFNVTVSMRLLLLGHQCTQSSLNL